MSEDRDTVDPGFYVEPPQPRARRIDPAELGEKWQAWLATIPPGWGLWAIEAGPESLP